MQAELDNHESNGSWERVHPSTVPRGRRLVKLVWVYKRKRDGKLKSRLCVQGCTQVPGVDYDQTWCGTMRASTLRLLSAAAAQLGLHMRRWDFTAAYLQGKLLDGEVTYCYPPQGYESAHGDPYVCKVVKPIYGMAQAGRRWQRSIFPWFTSPDQGFHQSLADPCVFYKHGTTTDGDGKDRSEVMMIGCYVDDLYVLSSHVDEYSLYASFARDLQARWNVEDEG